MSNRMKVLGLAAIGSLAVAAGCATTSSEEPQGLLKPTITYEDIDSGPTPAHVAAASGPTDGGAAAAQATAPADPFANCFAKQPQQGMATLDCGQTDAVIANIVGKLTPDQVDQNFAAYAKNFPNDAKQERFTKDINGKSAQGLRINGASYAATMVILPHGAKHTRVVACRIQDNTPFTRCEAIVDQLAVQGIPANISGADQLPGYLVARAKPAQTVVENGDGGSAAPAPAPAK